LIKSAKRRNAFEEDTGCSTEVSVNTPVVRPATYSKRQEPCPTEVNAVKDGKKPPDADILCI
jgi:hypothetical protein